MPGRWQPPRKRSSDEPWGFESLTFRLRAPLADRLRLQPSKLAKRVRLPQGALERDRGSASGRLPGLEPGDGGSTPPPRTDAESSNGRMRRSERLHVGSIPASAAWEMTKDEIEMTKEIRSTNVEYGTSQWFDNLDFDIPSTFVIRISSLPPRSRGPTATTLGPHPGNDGSTPSGAT